MVQDNERVTKEAILGTSIAFIVPTIVMVVLAGSIFSGWQWWQWIVEMGVSIPIVIVMILYYGRDSKKCPNCSTRMEYNIEYCKKCGTHMPSKCPECGANIKPDGAFCEKCGIKLLENTAENSTFDNSISPQPTKIIEKEPKGNFKYCPACGSKTGAYANNCSSCGIEL